MYLNLIFMINQNYIIKVNVNDFYYEIPFLEKVV